MLRLLTILLTLAGTHAQGLLIDPYRFAAPPDLNNGLIAYWKTDETGVVTRVDSEPTGTPQNMTANGANSLPGKINNAVYLAATVWVDRADSSDLSTGNIDFTWAFWVHMDNKLADKYIIGKWNVGAANTKEYLFYYINAQDRFSWAVSDCTTFGEVKADNLGSPALSTWYFVVVWHDATNNLLGVQVNDGTANTVAWTTGGCDTATGPAFGALYQGGSGSSGSANTRLDEIGFWKRLLTAAEKTALYNAGSGISCCPFP